MLQSVSTEKATATLEKLFESCLQAVTITYVEMLNEINLAQVFLWF